jgi:hypothetical protein
MALARVLGVPLAHVYRIPSPIGIAASSANARRQVLETLVFHGASF